MTIKQIKLKVIPRSSRNEIIKDETTGEIKVKLTAAPVDGEANKKLIAFLSDEWDMPKSKIRIIKGETSKNKLIEIEED